MLPQFASASVWLLIVVATPLAVGCAPGQPPAPGNQQAPSAANAESSNRAGMAAAGEGRYDEAYELFTDAIAHNAHPNTFFNRGLTAIKMGYYEDALADFDETLKLGLKDGRVYLNRGVALDGLGRHAEAMSDYNTSIQLDPQNATAYYNRGGAFERGKHDEAAIADYSKAVELAPQMASAYWNRGNVFLKQRKYVGAVADWSTVQKLEPENGHAYGCLAVIYATCPDPSLRNGTVAIEHATKANQLGDMPRHLTLAALAAANAESGKFDEAIQWQTKSVESAPASDRAALKARLELYRAGQPFHGDFFNLSDPASEPSPPK